MRKIFGSVFVSLDGVMQAPGNPDEDRTGDFKLGGWLPTFGDDAVGERVDKRFTPPFDLLLGRRTYDIFAAYWPYATGEWKSMGTRIDRAAKYVVTRGDQRFDWQNSHRLESIDAIAALKRGEGPDLIIQGSGTLYGWDGGFGTSWINDPGKELVGIVMTQSSDFLFSGAREMFWSDLYRAVE